MLSLVLPSSSHTIRLIAATYTPLVAVPLVHDPLICRRLLVRVWMTAFGGAAKTWLWPNAPRFLSALTYVAMGWSALPYLPVLSAAVDSHVLALVSCCWCRRSWWCCCCQHVQQSDVGCSKNTKASGEAAAAAVLA